MAAFSARNARIILNSTSFPGLKWTINTRVDEIDTSNFETRGYTDYTAGLWDADVSFDLIHPGGASPVLAGLYPGATVTDCRFYLDYAALPPLNVYTAASDGNASTRYFQFAYLLVTSMSIDAEVRSFVRVSVTAKNKGQFTFPGV